MKQKDKTMHWEGSFHPWFIAFYVFLETTLQNSPKPCHSVSSLTVIMHHCFVLVDILNNTMTIEIILVFGMGLQHGGYYYWCMHASVSS
jgi:hypothetical protein